MIFSQAIMFLGMIFLFAVGIAFIIGLMAGVEMYFRQTAQKAGRPFQKALFRWFWVTGLLVLIVCLAYAYILSKETID